MNLKSKLSTTILSLFMTGLFFTSTSSTMNKNETTAFLEITLDIKSENRANASAVYQKYKEPFLKQIKGATSKSLLIRNEDVQVLHGFKSEQDANAYLSTSLFSQDIVGELGPLLEGDPNVRIYQVFQP